MKVKYKMQQLQRYMKWHGTCTQTGNQWRTYPFPHCKAAGSRIVGQVTTLVQRHECFKSISSWSENSVIWWVSNFIHEIVRTVQWSFFLICTDRLWKDRTWPYHVMLVHMQRQFIDYENGGKGAHGMSTNTQRIGCQLSSDLHPVRVCTSRTPL